MKLRYLGQAFLAVAAMLCTFTIAIVREAGHLGKYEWSVPYLVAAIALCIILGVVSMVSAGRQQEKKGNLSPPPQTPPVSMHQANKQEQHVYVGLSDHKREREQEDLKQEETAIEFMRVNHPAHGYQTAEIASTLCVKHHEARAVLDRLLRKNRVFQTQGINIPNSDGLMWYLEYAERA